jgi:hypothetical protein
MNPMIVLFFISLAIEDFFFRNGDLLKYYISSILVYAIFNIFTPESKYNSPQRKFVMADFSHSSDPSVYCKLKPEVTKASIFLEKLSQKIGKKITWNLLVTKIMGLSIEKYPEINCAIRYGKLFDRASIDLSMLIDVREGKVN